MAQVQVKDLKAKQQAAQAASNAKPQVYDFDPSTSAADVILGKLETTDKGLTDKEAKKRLEEYGYNEPPRKKEKSIVLQIFS